MVITSDDNTTISPSLQSLTELICCPFWHRWLLYTYNQYNKKRES